MDERSLERPSGIQSRGGIGTILLVEEGAQEIR